MVHEVVVQLAVEQTSAKPELLEAISQRCRNDAHASTPLRRSAHQPIQSRRCPLCPKRHRTAGGTQRRHHRDAGRGGTWHQAHLRARLLAGQSRCAAAKPDAQPPGAGIIACSRATHGHRHQRIDGGCGPHQCALEERGCVCRQCAASCGMADGAGKKITELNMQFSKPLNHQIVTYFLLSTQ